MTTERKALAAYNTARDAYDARPAYDTASAVLAAAVVLCNISDDYAAVLDEADDIMAEPHTVDRPAEDLLEDPNWVGSRWHY